MAKRCTIAPPDFPSLGYSLQLGRGALIAHQTSVATVSNFRVADIARGGQGVSLGLSRRCLLAGTPHGSPLYPKHWWHWQCDVSPRLSTP
ncbi:anhydro-N-acetylmuramic acid kinase [Neosynechococcus sphagnicola]|uniref:anhydro-N-acetylmuramic acid kinase n=1 Tax=Neosynechococcus sphagnicola TaxID=1501145 RepID=UPI003B82DC57